MNKDFENRRLPWEHEDHWKLRKKFLLCHQDRFSEDQLICLSQIYMNIKVLGCRYSNEIMLRIVELDKDLQNFTYYEDNTTKNASSPPLPPPVPQPTVTVTKEEKQENPRKKTKNSRKNRKKRTGKRKIGDNSTDSSLKNKISKNNDEIPESLKKLSQVIVRVQMKEKYPIQILNISLTKRHMKAKCIYETTKDGFICNFYINDFLISNGTGFRKREAQQEAYKKAIEKICKEETSHKPVGKRKAVEEVISNEQNLNVNVKNIVVLDELYLDPSRSSHQVITRTASFNNVPLTFKYSQLGNEKIRCDLIFNKSILAQAIGISKQTARNAAADIALEKLKKNTYTVMIKQRPPNEEIVSREKLKECTLGNAITENNVGYKLLQKMGWNNENSTDSAVFARQNESFKRQGLGFSETEGVTKAFIKQLEKLIANYASSETDSDLVFSSEFTKEERKEIHRIAQNHSLKSISRGGNGPARHSVLSRRFKPFQLLRYLLNAGGQTDKYELLMPNKDSQ